MDPDPPPPGNPGYDIAQNAQWIVQRLNGNTVRLSVRVRDPVAPVAVSFRRRSISSCGQIGLCDRVSSKSPTSRVS